MCELKGMSLRRWTSTSKLRDHNSKRQSRRIIHHKCAELDKKYVVLFSFLFFFIEGGNPHVFFFWKKKACEVIKKRSKFKLCIFITISIGGLRDNTTQHNTTHTHTHTHTHRIRTETVWVEMTSA
jgi:hypothetical protein